MKTKRLAKISQFVHFASKKNPFMSPISFLKYCLTFELNGDKMSKKGKSKIIFRT